MIHIRLLSPKDQWISYVSPANRRDMSGGYVLKVGDNSLSTEEWDKIKRSRWLLRLISRGLVKIDLPDFFQGLTPLEQSAYVRGVGTIGELNRLADLTSSRVVRDAIGARIKELHDGESSKT